MRPSVDRLFDWILSLGPTARFNLTASGLPEPDLGGMGIDTSYESYAAAKDEHERLFAEEVARLYGVDPENVLLTNGGSEAIFLSYAVFAGRQVSVPLPNYPPMFTVPRSLGIEVRGASNGAAAADGTMFGVTDPNNPTGVSLSQDAVEALLGYSKRNGSTVYVNETYKEYTFPRRPQTLFGRADNVVTSNTMTKFFGLGRLRVGWVLAEEKKARRLLYAKWSVSGHDSGYSLWIAAQVLRRRAKFVERARETLRRNSSLVRGFLEETEGVSSELGAAPFCLVHYTRKTDSVTLARRLLKETGVLVAPGDFFGAPRSFRLCFTADGPTIRNGLAALSEFFSRRSS